jgi:aminoglycoside 2''-phosphotransferase
LASSSACVAPAGSSTASSSSGAGDFSTAYLVNREWVFRFAKHRQAAASLKREACLLPRIAGQFDVDVPSPEVVSVQASPAFAAYRMLPGPALTKERYFALPEPDRERCAGELARFLMQMHATDARRARACGIQAGDYAARYAGVLAVAREQLFAQLGTAERSFVEASVDDFLTSHAESELRPVVLHGDLSPDHVLYDEASRSISRVIDFGDVVIGDPAWDLVYLYEDYGLDFLRRVLPPYPSSEPRQLLERAYRFYVLDLIEWAVRCANEDFRTSTRPRAS